MKIFIFILAVISLMSCNNEKQIIKKSNTIVVYGDSRTNDAIHKKIVEKILNVNPVAIMFTGDMVANGNDLIQWKTFKDIALDKFIEYKINFYSSLGNHEGDGKNYLEILKLPGNERFYSINELGINFIILDNTSDISENSEQYKFLTDELKKIDKTKVNAVVMHYPVINSGRHSGHNELKNLLHPLFKESGIDIVFSGHDHNYEKLQKDGVYYIVTGGGGAPLYDLKKKDESSLLFIKEYHFCKLYFVENILNIEVIDINSKVIDKFSINKNNK